MFTAIFGLAKKFGTTKATDKYFMNLLSKSDKTISRSMKKLEELNLIERETFFNQKTKKRSRKIRIMKKTPQVIHAPMEIYFYDLKDGTKMLLIQLVGLSKNDGFTFVNNKSLADKMGVSIKQIERYLSELKENSLIIIENAGTPNRNIQINSNLTIDELEMDQWESFGDNLLEMKEYIRNHQKNIVKDGGTPSLLRNNPLIYEIEPPHFWGNRY